MNKDQHLIKHGNITITRAITMRLLTLAPQLEWSLQGLGMLRCYLSPDTRLHIWSGDDKVKDASTLHTHPWDFDSLVVAGRVVNQRFKETALGGGGAVSMERQMIRCGEGGGLHSEPSKIQLMPQPPEIVTAGYGYSQEAAEIHESRPDDGTITIINRRVPEAGHPDFANVYWPEGEEWGSAEPRPATASEVQRIVARGLDRMHIEEERAAAGG